VAVRLLITVGVAFFIGLVYFVLTRDLRPLVLMVLVGLVFLAVDLFLAPHLMPVWDVQRLIPRVVRLAIGYALPIVLALAIANLPIPGLLSRAQGFFQSCLYLLAYLLSATIAYVFLKSPLPVRAS
jgi:hypothetical protein